MKAVQYKRTHAGKISSYRVAVILHQHYFSNRKAGSQSLNAIKIIASIQTLKFPENLDFHFNCSFAYPLESIIVVNASIMTNMWLQLFKSVPSIYTFRASIHVLTKIAVLFIRKHGEIITHHIITSSGAVITIPLESRIFIRMGQRTRPLTYMKRCNLNIPLDSKTAD